MKRIPINKLRGIYRTISEKKTLKPYFQKSIFNYLNLSVHFSRDDREFDLYNYDLFEYLEIKKKIDLRKIKNNYSKYFCANVVAVNTNHVNKSPINTNFAKAHSFY